MDVFVYGTLTEPSTAERILDRYAFDGPAVPRGLYVRRSLPADDGGTVECFIGDPAKLGVTAVWPGTGPFADRVDRFLEYSDVVVATR